MTVWRNDLEETVRLAEVLITPFGLRTFRRLLTNSLYPDCRLLARFTPPLPDEDRALPN